MVFHHLHPTVPFSFNSHLSLLSLSLSLFFFFLACIKSNPRVSNYVCTPINFSPRLSLSCFPFRAYATVIACYSCSFLRSYHYYLFKLSSLYIIYNYIIIIIKTHIGKTKKMPSSGSFLRQKSGRSTSWRWSTGNRKYSTVEGGYNCERSLKQMEELCMYGNDNAGLGMRKRVMVVVDHTSHSKHAMMWALTHVANKGDLLTLLHITPPGHKGSGERTSGPGSYSPYLASSLGSLCKASRPEVEVEALVIQGPKLATVMNQVKKLEVTVLVLGQKRPSTLFSCLCGTSNIEDFAEQCINNAECWTVGVRKQTKGMSGYLITTRMQKDFWLLA